MVGEASASLAVAAEVLVMVVPTEAALEEVLLETEVTLLELA